MAPVFGSFFTEWTTCSIRLKRLLFVLQFGHLYGVDIGFSFLDIVNKYFLQSSKEICNNSGGYAVKKIINSPLLPASKLALIQLYIMQMEELNEGN
jgi:hypothetical protein